VIVYVKTYAVMGLAEVLRNSTDVTVPDLTATTWRAVSTNGSCLEKQGAWFNEKYVGCVHAGVEVTALSNASHANRIHGIFS
jgi:hypothetical protein